MVEGGWSQEVTSSRSMEVWGMRRQAGSGRQEVTGRSLDTRWDPDDVRQDIRPRSRETRDGTQEKGLMRCETRNGTQET